MSVYVQDELPGLDVPLPDENTFSEEDDPEEVVVEEEFPEDAYPF